MKLKWCQIFWFDSFKFVHQKIVLKKEGFQNEIQRSLSWKKQRRKGSFTKTQIKITILQRRVRNIRRFCEFEQFEVRSLGVRNGDE
jgi:16S rRNA U516 pseudouridylate synthase RsuA-like enzyme